MVSDLDNELVKRAQVNPSDFEELIIKYNLPILKYCCRILNYNMIEAEDAASETWIKVYQNLQTFDPKLKFTSWLYRIAHNQCVDMIRKNSKKFLMVDQEILEAVKLDFDDSIAIKNDLEKVLKKLNQDDRDLLVLFYLQELSISEISDILRVKPQAVSVKLFRAKERARQIVINNV